MSMMKTIEIDLDVNAAIEQDRRSFDETANDILRRRLVIQQRIGRPLETNAVDLESIEEPGERITGRWTVELNGRRASAANLKSAYRTLLLLLHDRDPNFLQSYSEQRARARRFVARTPADLYLNSPKLAKHHAKTLTAGWYFDTNLSTDQVARRARIAARLSGLRYGRDVRILNGLEEI